MHTTPATTGGKAATESAPAVAAGRHDLPALTLAALGVVYGDIGTSPLYTAKGTAALLVPLSSVLDAATGSWHVVFIVASNMNGVAALMAWFVLRPMRRAQVGRGT